MIASKLTSKGRTTIPQPVRGALRLREGDDLLYVIEPDRVILMKAEGAGLGPFASFEEWNSEADRRAYADLRAK